jgi:hypothetical protein
MAEDQSVLEELPLEFPPRSKLGVAPRIPSISADFHLYYLLARPGTTNNGYSVSTGEDCARIRTDNN